jgi:hypothetical protein
MKIELTRYFPRKLTPESEQAIRARSHKVIHALQFPTASAAMSAGQDVPLLLGDIDATERVMERLLEMINRDQHAGCPNDCGICLAEGWLTVRRRGGA